MRVLLSAFAISPTRGSEPGVGWQCAIHLAQYHDVTILYGDLNGCARSKHELEEWLRDHPKAPRMTLAYVAPSRLSVICERLHSKPGLRPLYYWGYQLWQKRALAVARGLHRSAPFDLVHQVTYATYWEPGYLWKLGIPYYWGPISGGNVMPLRYIPILGIRGSVEAVARFILNKVTLFTHPRIGSATRRASHIWCVTAAEKEILSRYSERISMMSEAGTVPSETSLRSLAAGQALQIIWSGLHIERKALPILVHAIAQLNPGSHVEVHVLGAGRGSSKETDRAKALAERLGVSSKIVWHGNLPRAEALQKMRDGHVLVHTSLLEGTPWVVMEALASGMPVICHDACGMATVVTRDCGIKVPMTGLKESIRGFRDAINALIDDPARLKQLSKGAAQRAKALTWEQKILEFNHAYEETLLASV
jgi:glycosyltransferase involved in cell wall biosynthesis